MHDRQTIRKRMIGWMLVAMLLFAACAPEDLDMTPSPTPTPLPTATPSPTPLPEGFTEAVSAEEDILAELIANAPASIPAGAAQWRKDFNRGQDGVEPLLNVQNGVGNKVYYNEQTGGQMNLSFAVFDSAESASAHYERIRDIRSVLDTGTFDDTFPEPNIFGQGLYGSVAIFQIDNYFLEVSIELFSSTQENPLKSLARATIRYFDEIRPQIETAGGEGEETDDGT